MYLNNLLGKLKQSTHSLLLLLLCWPIVVISVNVFGRFIGARCRRTRKQCCSGPFGCRQYELIMSIPISSLFACGRVILKKSWIRNLSALLSVPTMHIKEECNTSTRVFFSPNISNCMSLRFRHHLLLILSEGKISGGCSLHTRTAHIAASVVRRERGEGGGGSVGEHRKCEWIWKHWSDNDNAVRCEQN